MKRILGVTLIAFFTSLLTFAIAKKYIYSDQVFTLQQTQNQDELPIHHAAYVPGSGSPDGGYVNLEDAADRAAKAVVHIKTEKKVVNTQFHNPFGDDLFEQFFGRSPFGQPQPQQGSGSGVIISQDGYIITNNHVVDGADEVSVIMNNKKTVTAKVVGKDAATDLALLKVEETNLPYLSFGNSDEVKLGQWVLAVGYPLSLETTVTAGIVSAKYRNIGINRSKLGQKGDLAIESFIQTDAAVNPGNSGGALVNSRGDLIGINSAIASPTGSYAGYSFAIPSNIVRKVSNDMMKFGNVQRAFLGISYVDNKNASPEDITRFGLDKIDGIYVREVNKSSAAEEAGLKPGDIITRLGQKEIKTGPQLSEQIAQYRPGDKTSITFVRDGVTKTGDITFKSKIGIADIDNANHILGATLRELNKQEARQMGVEGGVQVTAIQSEGLIAKQTRIRKSFIITQINDDPVSSVDELNKILAGNEDDFQIGGVYPNIRGIYYYVIRR